MPLVVTHSRHAHVLQSTSAARRHISICDVCRVGCSDWYCSHCDWDVCSNCLKADNRPDTHIGDRSHSIVALAPTTSTNTSTNVNTNATDHNVEYQPQAPTAPPLPLPPMDNNNSTTTSITNPLPPPDSNNLCVVCLSSPKTMTFIHSTTNTGHTCCCVDCASMFEGKPCPLCREPIMLIVKIYS